ncbi:hypothetical protein B0H13DRAFT_2345787 [Mycena leptocephala]|nr:hypothetical protein B0H13DRAFT_2345787 [Mycena leptocephala]
MVDPPSSHPAPRSRSFLPLLVPTSTLCNTVRGRRWLNGHRLHPILPTAAQLPDTPHAASVAFPNPSRPQCCIAPASLTSCAPPFPRNTFVCACELPTLHHCTTATTTATSAPSIHRIRLPHTPLVFATAAMLVIHPLRRHPLRHGRCAIRAVPIPSTHPPPTAVPIDAGFHAHRRCLTTYFHLDLSAQAPSNTALRSASARSMICCCPIATVCFPPL